MPIYEYECGSCGHRLEAFQKMSDAPLTECPQCKKTALTKLVSAAGFQLKGTGWYATDFRNKGKSEPAQKEDKSSNEGKSTDSSSNSETKAD